MQMQGTAQNTVNQFSDTLAKLGLPEWAVGPIVAAIVIIIGYFIAKIAAAIVSGAINKTGIGKKAKTTGGNIGKSLSKAVFWVVWLMFILLGLSQFEAVSEALAPINNMMTDILGYVPQLAIGAVVLGIGSMLAKVVKEALSSTLEAAQVDNIAGKYGFAGSSEGVSSNTISRSLGGLAGAIVLIGFAFTAIGIWDIPGISEPVAGMLESILGYIPRIFAAAIILAIAVFIGRFVSRLAQDTLPALGVDDSLSSIANLDGSASSKFQPSKVIGSVGFIGIVLMGLTAAMNALDIPELSSTFERLLGLGGSIVLGAIIIGVGIFIANVVARFVAQSAGDLAGTIVRYSLIVLIAFMGLSEMGIGGDIVGTAFSYALGAGAVAAGLGGALAFGLGGRDWAAKKLTSVWPNGTTRKK